ncbi:hypothetical protein CR513_06318, partial [Mucuna pruriens]
MEMIIDKHVNVELTLGRYKDEILCDIVPKEATHILLRRPWQFDRKVTHDGVTNKFSFVHKGNKVILKPLTPGEVIVDQLKIKKKEKGNKKKKLKGEKIKEKKDKKGKSILVNRISIKNVLLNKRKKESLLIWPTNMCLVLNSSLDNLLAAFERMPEELPPIRGINYQIDFMPKSKEIQRYMTQFLDKGLMKESKSQCAVLVILVPNKDGTWRMCMNCRTINSIMIRYRHLISYLDDLLDELYGVYVFSKIDLQSGLIVLLKHYQKPLHFPYICNVRTNLGQISQGHNLVMLNLYELKSNRNTKMGVFMHMTET